MNKIKTLAQLKVISARLKKAGKRIVFTNGCFDLLHFGHAQYLAKAKQAGDILIVGINSDASLRSIKGKKRPLIAQKYRAGLVAALKSVDFVFIFTENTPLNAIQAIQPSVLIKGADWKKENIIGANFVKSYGGKVKTVALEKGLSTSNLIKKIAKLY